MKSVRGSFSLGTLCLAFACVLLGAMSSQLARAQTAPSPIGTWANQTERLVVQQNGACAFLFNGKVTSSGTCYWEKASAKGGILDLTYPMPLAPGHVYWSVVWVNQTTITVNGDVFYKQAN
jgi:hypothetical protein